MLPRHYSFKHIKDVVNDPHLIFSELNRLYHRRFYSRDYNTSGIDIFDEDWDNLLILDACRYDLFKEVVDLPGTLEQRESRGSATVEFLKANCSNRELLDIVYITSNPQLYRRYNEINPKFHHIENVWEDNWMDDIKSVPPEIMSNEVISAADQFPNKRIIGHYIQPHYPFISDSGKELPNSSSSSSFWRELRRGDLDDIDDIHTLVKNAYKKDMKIALDSIENILDNLTGKTVITADHGQLFGERIWPLPIREYAHPTGIYVDKLVKVPWFIVGSNQQERKQTIAENPIQDQRTVSEETVDQRLRDLGYI